MSGQAIDFSQYESTAPDTGKQVDFSKYAGPMTSNGIAAPQGTESTMTAGVKGAKDLLTGAAEGAANTVGNAVSGTARLLNKIPGVGEYLAPKQGIEALEAKTKERSTPENTTQAIGRTGEQIGEWLIPSGAEEKVASLLPKMGKAIPIAARIGTSALESGLRNASQGGSFGTGAEAGVGGELLNQGLQKAAPIVAETALGVTGRMRGHGKTIGDAALNELSGVRPITLQSEAGRKIGDLTGQLETAAANSATPASTAPAIKIVDDAIATYQKRNSPFAEKLENVRDQLTMNRASGKAIPTQLPASDILELKRGVGDLVNSWSPGEAKGARPIIGKIYGALDQELDRTVPESKDLNQRISSLIPVKTRASIIANGAPTAQRIAARVARPTGALVGAGIGGGLGYERGGIPGAVAGGAMGVAIPELLTSPTTQMVMARGIRSPLVPALSKAIPLQLDRPSAENEEQETRKKE
jgi:hypothetical protein